MLLSLGLFNLGASCYPKPPNEFICIELSANRGFCSKTLSDEEIIVDNEAWLETKRTALIVPITSWGKIKQFILESCKQFSNCDQVNIEKKIELLGL